MLRALLADRFGLVAHAETRQLPLYELAPTREDGRLGGQLRRAGTDCAPFTMPAPVAGSAPPPPPPPPPPLGEGAVPFPPRGAVFRRPSLLFDGHFSARSATMEQLALRLSLLVRRPVLDRTGLAGEFDIDLTFTPELQGSGPTVASPDAPGLTTAIREQLGLKLEPGRGPIQVLVVDRATRPTQN